MPEPSRTLPEIYPPMGLRLTCGPLVLEGTRPEHVADLVVAAKEGVYEGPSPFTFDWPSLPDQDLNMHQHLWSVWGRATPEVWSLKLSVMVDGHAVGCQDVFNKENFLESRVLETGSWIGLRHQGHGIGTRMRQMMAMFAFDHLGAEILESGYVDGNERSRGVSRKVGYMDNGSHRQWVGGKVRTVHYVALTPDRLVRPPEPLEVEGVAAFRRFIGLDGEGPQARTEQP